MNDKKYKPLLEIKETEAKWEGKGLAQGHTESLVRRTAAFHAGSFSDQPWLPLSPWEIPFLLPFCFWATAAPTSDLPWDPPVALTDPRLRVWEIKLQKDKHYFQSALRD